MTYFYIIASVPNSTRLYSFKKVRLRVRDEIIVKRSQINVDPLIEQSPAKITTLSMITF